MRRVVLSVWTGIVAMSFLTLAPWILGGLVDQYGLTATQAGRVLGINLTGTIVGPLLALASVHRAGARTWAGVAFGAMAVGHGATPFEHSFGGLVILQAIAGLGAGVGLAAANVMAAATPKPEQTFGQVLAGQMLFGAAWFFSSSLFPALSASGVGRVFGMMSGMAVASLMLLHLYPRSLGEAALATGRRLPWSLPAALLCTSLLAHYIANTAIWAYLERIGIAAGFVDRQVSFALGLSLVAGIAGALLTGGTSRRIGVVASLVVGIIAIAGATALLLGLRQYSTFVIATCVMIGSLCFAVPFYLALLAGFDRRGRWVLLGNVVIGTGIALGLGIGSFMVGGPGFDAILGFALALFTLALILALAAAQAGKSACARNAGTPDEADQ